MTEKLILVRPSLDWKEELLAYKEAFKSEHMYGGAGLYKFDKLSDWLVYLDRLSKINRQKKDGQQRFFSAFVSPISE